MAPRNRSPVNANSSVIKNNTALMTSMRSTAGVGIALTKLRMRSVKAIPNEGFVASVSRMRYQR